MGSGTSTSKSLDGIAYAAATLPKKEQHQFLAIVGAATEALASERHASEGAGRIRDEAELQANPELSRCSLDREESFEKWTPRRGTVSAGHKLHQHTEVNILCFSDPGQDLDDEMAFIMMRHLIEEGLINLVGIVTTLAPAYDRARLCRGTLNLLGLSRVPVAVGTDGGDTDGKHTADPFLSHASSYMPSFNSEASVTLEPGRRFLSRTYREASPGSLTLLIIASLKDAALFLRDNESLFVQKTKEVVIQGGVLEVPSDGQLFEPDTSNNLTFDKAASAFFFRRCQELGVRLVLCSRYAVYAAKMSRGTYDRLADMGSSIGRRLRNAQRESIESLWARAALPADDDNRKGLPERCDRKWFMNTFCSGKDDPHRTASDPVWDLVDGFMQYDTMALFAAIPSLRRSFFDPVTAQVNGVEHLVIGVSEDKPNVAEPKTDLLEMLHDGFCTGLALDHHFKAQVIIIQELRPDTFVDLILACAMLRTLFELGTVHCTGIVASVDSTDATFMASDPIRRLHKTLDALGLRFIPLHVASGEEGTKILSKLYADALPSGVTLINTASLTLLSKFAEVYSRQFREKTARVVLLCGAKPREYKGSMIEPDPSAQNNRLNLSAANYFFQTAQELSVPLVVISRFTTQNLQLPRALFEVLKTHGGEVGGVIFESQQASLQELWRKANAPVNSTEREKLPPRCNREWFLATFCDDKPFDPSKDIWEQVDNFNAYTPLALLAALPAVIKRFLKTLPIQIRAATHQVIGWSHDDPCIADHAGLQKALAQYIVYGCRLNVSAYSLPPLEPIQLASGASMELLVDHEAIESMIPAHAAYSW